DDRDHAPHLPTAESNDTQRSARISRSTVNSLQPANPCPRATASFTASQLGSSRRWLALMPMSAHAASTAARVAEPSGAMTVCNRCKLARGSARPARGCRPAFPQKRQLEADYRQAVVKISAEAALGEHPRVMDSHAELTIAPQFLVRLL